MLARFFLQSIASIDASRKSEGDFREPAPFAKWHYTDAPMSSRDRARVG